jgi:small subunit ribosomal protein S24e
MLNQKEEKLLQRKEVNFRVDFEKVTPTKEELKKQISEHLKLDPELVKIEKADQKFGERSANVSALIYDNKEIMKKIEVRNKKAKKEVKKEEKKE